MSNNSTLPHRSPRARHDGWTPERQLAFLGALSVSRSVTRSAAAAGMSRESAYRLRDRPDGALFAALDKRRAVVIPGLVNKAGAQGLRFLPRWLLRRIAGTIKL